MRFVINRENYKLFLINNCTLMSHIILSAIFIDAAPPILHHSSYFSHLHTRTPFVSHYTLNTHYFCLLSHYAHSTLTFHLQHIHCSCFCFVQYTLSPFIYFKNSLIPFALLKHTTLVPLLPFTHISITHLVKFSNCAHPTFTLH